MQSMSDLEAPLRAALSSGSVGTTLAIAFLAGVLTSLTPCVYPMIAITVSVFGARNTASRAEGAMLSTSFVLGMATLFTPLGLIAATTGGVFGAALASPVVLVGLALLFVVLAASMFGAFELDLPSGLKTRLASVGGVGFKGAFVLGMVSALIAAPCTGPVLGALLTWVSTSKALVTGGLALFAYALGLGLLFWVVGTFSVTLPKSGRWLSWVKSAFGVIMLTAAFYYVRPLLPSLPLPAYVEPRERLLLVSLVLLALAFGLGAIHLSFEGGDLRERLRKGTGVGLAVIGLLGMIRCAEAPAGEGIVWLNDYEQAKSLAVSTNKPLLVDFSASWCGACGELDRHTFSHPEVVREGERFVAVRVDLSPGQDTAEKRAILAGYAQRGLPLVVLHDAQGKEVSRVTGFMEPNRFIELLRSVN